LYNQEEKDMNTQDKEFDDLFRSKLDNFEIEPTAQVWPNINAELDRKGRKKSAFFMLRIAASVILLLVAGILFIPKKDNPENKPGKNNLVVNHTAGAAVKDAKNTSPVNPPTKKEEQVIAVVVPVSRIAKFHPDKKIAVPVSYKNQDAPVIVKTEPVKADQQQALAALPQKSAETIKPVVPGIETPLTVKQVDTDQTQTIKAAPALASAQIPLTKQSTPVTRKHGIRNMGDLVNLVLARVDKRKDKAIEFTDTDDDESVITAVNMGPFKIKKDK
jgi:hypothetical protein